MNHTLLLVEDDPVTCAFLASASRELGARVDTAATLADATALATRTGYDLLLIDANLPDGSGADFLQRLRSQGNDTPALAHTASNDPGDAQRLRDAGFLDVLIKPIGASAWQAALRRALQNAASSSASADADNAAIAIDGLPIWNDAKAAAALGGNMAHVHALRDLFLQELPGQRDAVCNGNSTVRRHHLHRLLASCGFVGAARLQAAAATLQAVPDSAEILQEFITAAEQTLAATPGA